MRARVHYGEEVGARGRAGWANGVQMPAALEGKVGSARDPSMATDGGAGSRRIHRRGGAGRKERAPRGEATSEACNMPVEMKQ